MLGEAGLLDGRKVTTSWLFADRLAARYPATSVCAEELVIQGAPTTTTAAFSASLDLATALVREDFGDRVADATARITLVGNRSSQSPYVVEAMVPNDNGPFAKAVGMWLTENLAEPYPPGDVGGRVPRRGLCAGISGISGARGIGIPAQLGGPGLRSLALICARRREGSDWARIHSQPPASGR